MHVPAGPAFSRCRVRISWSSDADGNAFPPRRKTCDVHRCRRLWRGTRSSHRQPLSIPMSSTRCVRRRRMNRRDGRRSAADPLRRESGRWFPPRPPASERTRSAERSNRIAILASVPDDPRSVSSRQRAPPLVDYPNHLARFWLLSGGANDPMPFAVLWRRLVQGLDQHRRRCRGHRLEQSCSRAAHRLPGGAAGRCWTARWV